MSKQEVEVPKKTGTLKDFFLYFVYLGLTGFGGPVVLVSHMERDLVEKKKWVTLSDYLEGLALAQVAPGPVATQLAIYLGWQRWGVLGAFVTGVGFLLPAFIIVLFLAELYLRYNGFTWVQDVFYGLSAAVIAIILKSIHNLAHKTLKTDTLLWILSGIAAGVTLCLQAGILWIFLLSGLVTVLVRSSFRDKFLSLSPLPSAALALTEHQEKVLPPSMLDMAIFFAKSGTVVFGSGLAIIPFLQTGIVEQFHWLTERQFIDAVAISMITPGPVLVIVAFIGYLVAGLSGATVAALAVHIPCFLVVILAAPHYQRFAQHVTIKAFISGVIAAVVGAIAGSVVIIAKQSIVDIPTILIGLITLIVLMKFKKVPEPVLVVAAGITGVLIKGGL